MIGSQALRGKGAGVKFSSIQVCRALAANAVVLSHLVAIEQKYAHGYTLLPEWLRFAGWSGVHFFFVISGFVMMFAYRPGNWTGFLAARLLRIYPVYWVYTTMVLAVFLVAPAMVNSSVGQPQSIIKSYLLWPDAAAPLLAVGWTLIHEMYFYLALAILIALAVPLRYALPLWASVLAAGAWILPEPVASPVLGLLLSPLTFEFLLGAVAGLLIRRKVLAFGRTALLAGIALALAGGVLYVRWGVAHGEIVTSILLLGLPFVLVVYGLAVVERRHGWPKLPQLERLGDASYSTYLGHVLVLSAIGRVYAALPIHGWAVEAVFLAVCLVAANIAGVLSYRWIEQPILRLRRYLPRANSVAAPANA